MQAPFAGSRIEEAHFTTNVVETADQQIKGAERCVLHRDGSIWKTHLADQSTDEADKGS